MAEPPALPMSQQAFDALRRAFIEKKADYIEIDGWSPRWQIAAAEAAAQVGWLTSELIEVERQYSVKRYRPTALGWEMLEKPNG